MQCDLMLDKLELNNLIRKGLTERSIAEHFSCSQTNVRYWLAKYDLKTEQNAKALYKKGLKYCPCCGEVKALTEFNKRTRNGVVKEYGAVYCKDCTSAESSVRKYNFTQKCVDYKGGACEICGYDKSIGALEFHHIDRATKKFEIGKLTSKTFSDQVKKELDKCMLLCKNCHGEIHHNERDLLIFNQGIWKIKNDKRQIIK